MKPFLPTLRPRREEGKKIVRVSPVDETFSEVFQRLALSSKHFPRFFKPRKTQRVFANENPRSLKNQGGEPQTVENATGLRKQRLSPTFESTETSPKSKKPLAFINFFPKGILNLEMESKGIIFIPLYNSQITFPELHDGSPQWPKVFAGAPIGDRDPGGKNLSETPELKLWGHK